MLSLELGQLESAKILLHNKADPNQTHTNISPIHVACQRNYQDILQLLIQAGAFIDRLDSQTGKTGLHVAVENHCFEIASILLEAGADVFYKDSRGENAIHLAVRVCNNSTDIMLLCMLLEHLPEDPN